MGGAQIAIVISLLALAVALFGVAPEALWPASTTPGWVGRLALWTVAAAIAVILNAFGRGPKWMRSAVNALVSPADLKPYPDMPIRTLAQRVSPDLVENYVLENVGQGQFERVCRLVRLGSLDNMPGWGG